MSKTRTGMYAGKKRDAYFCEQVRKSKVGYRPTDEAIANGVKVRKEKASLIKEVGSGFVGKIWEIEEYFNIDRRAVYANCKTSNPISKFTWKGRLNFVKLLNV